jgi:hypothetical protein
LVPRWYPWKVDTSSALIWSQDLMGKGFSEVHQSCAISSTAIMSDLARMFASLPTDVIVVS